MLKVILLVVFFFTFASSEEVSSLNNILGYKVLSVQAETNDQFQLLKQLYQSGHFDFWSRPRHHGSTSIMASSTHLPDLISLLESQGMKYSVKIQDVKALITQQDIANEKLRSISAEMSWTAYHSFENIEAWLLNLRKNPIVNVISIGNSTENRYIYQVSISIGLGSNNKPKPIIYMDANIHAREWITSAVATWIINELTSKTEQYKFILDNFDFYIVPVLNPDGFAYSMEKPDEEHRMWRKTRSINPGFPQCIGCDANRNFEYHFGGESTSDDPCNITYKGPNAFSEPETRALRDAIKGILKEEPKRILAYYTIHSYGQLWLLSWGFTPNAYPSDYDELLEWGKLSTEAIYKVHGKNYTYGQSADLLNPVGGAADDWAKLQGIKYVTTFELRDIDEYGFLLPADQIIPTAEEAWQGILAINKIKDGNTTGSGNSLLVNHWFLSGAIFTVLFILSR